MGSPTPIFGRERATRVLQLDDLTMLIGASSGGEILEIGVSRAEGIDFIIHAMPARPKFLR